MQKENNLFNNNHPKPVSTNYAINELISIFLCENISRLTYSIISLKFIKLEFLSFESKLFELFKLLIYYKYAYSID